MIHSGRRNTLIIDSDYESSPYCVHIPLLIKRQPREKKADVLYEKYIYKPQA